MSSQPQSTSETPMSDNMSDTSCVHENSKWDPPEDELEPDSQQLSNLSSSSSESISSSLSSGSLPTPVWEFCDPRRSVRQSRSARLDDPSMSTEQSLTSCLHLTLLRTTLLLFHKFCCFCSKLTGLVVAVVVEVDPCELDPDPGGGIESKNSVTTSGSVCRMTLGCGRTTIEVKSGKSWAGKKMVINDILKSYFKSINVIRNITF